MGLSNGALAKATAGPKYTLTGKTFYAGDKAIKTGEMPVIGESGTAIVSAGGTYTFDTAEKYCAENMTVTCEKPRISVGSTKSYDSGVSSVSVNAPANSLVCSISTSGVNISGGTVLFKNKQIVRPVSSTSQYISLVRSSGSKITYSNVTYFTYCIITPNF